MAEKSHAVFTYDEIREEELRYIADVRVLSGNPNKSGELVGLAMSGGGIRSATFQLGVLQGLATAGLLPLIDYISAVSGGGYTCGWLMKWIKSTQQYPQVVDKLTVKPSKPAPARIQWLRRYTNYLTPTVGISSLDSFLFGTTYVHHLVFNLIVLVFTFAFLLFIPRLFLGLLLRSEAYPDALAVIGGSLACGSILLLLLRLLSDGKLSTPLEWRSHLPIIIGALLFTGVYPIAAEPQAVRLALGAFVLLPVLAKSRGIPNRKVLSEVATSIRTAFASALAAAVPARLSHQVRIVLRLGYRLLTKRATQAILSGILLLCFLAAVDSSRLAPSWPHALILGALWALPVDNRFETTKMSRNARRLAIVLPAFISSFLITGYMFYRRDAGQFQKIWVRYEAVSEYLEQIRYPQVAIGLCLFAAAALAVIAFARSRLAMRFSNVGDALWRHSRSPLKHLLAAVGLMAVAVLCLFQYPAVIRFMVKVKAGSSQNIAFLHTVSTIAPGCAALGTLCCSVAMGLLGSLVSAYKRERLMVCYAAMYQCVAAWLFIVVTSLYIPALLYTTSEAVFNVLVVTWILIGIFAIWASLTAVLESRPKGMIAVMAWACPYLFAWGFVLGCAMWDSAVVKVTWSTTLAEYFQATADSMTKLGTFAYAAAFGGLAAFFAARFGLNSSSMHVFYQARLARAYLLEELPGSSVALPSQDVNDVILGPPTWLNDYTPKNGYVGPLPIFNAALNLTGGSDLAVQERKAANFIFTPLVSGFDVRAATQRLGPDEFEDEKTFSKELGLYSDAYARTAEFRYARDAGIRLAAALSISGSAIGSQMGFLTSPRIRFTHTLFNMRLGWWLANPRYPGAWNRRIPRQRVRMLMAEFLGRTDDLGAYVHLSDGGHFENLGMYELVKRRCRVIIVSDASEEKAGRLGCLARALERCRADFGVEIQVCADEVLPDPTGISEANVIVGSIAYADGAAGVLVYIRSALTTDSPYDLRQRRAEDKIFPNHPTSNQWFNESLFEAYRVLGMGAANSFSNMLRASKQSDFIGQCEELRKASLGRHSTAKAAG